MDIHHFILETPRLIVRPFEETDTDALQRVLDEAFGAEPPEERRAYLTNTRAALALYKMLYQPPYGDRAIILKSTGEMIGSVGFVSCVMPFDTLPYFKALSSEAPTGRFTLEFGMFWALDNAHRGQGYATEAARAMIDFAFTHLSLKRIVATTEYDNAASIAVMERLGMQIERNPNPKPEWFQIVGILNAPQRE